MSSPYATLGDADDDDGETTLRSQLDSAVQQTKTELRRRLFSLRFGDWFSILLTLGVVAIVGTAFAGSTGAVLAGGAGLFVALTLILTNSGNPLLAGVGVITAVFGGITTLIMAGFLVFLILQEGFFGFFAGLGLLSLALASLGAFLTPVRTLSGKALLRTNLFVLIGILGVALVLAVQLLPHGELRELGVDAAGALGAEAVGLLVSVDPAHALATFFIMVSITLLAVGLLIESLPIERLLPADRRASVVRAIEQAQQRRSLAVRGCFVVGVVAGGGLLLNALALQTGEAAGIQPYTRLLRTDVLLGALPAPLGEIVVGVVTAQSLRLLLIVTVAASVATMAAQRLIRLLRRGWGWLLVRLAAPLVGGIVAAVPVGYAASQLEIMDQLVAAAPPSLPPELVEFAESVPSFAAGTAVVLVLLAVFFLPLGALGGLKTVFVLPKRAGSVALASIGLVGVAVAAMIVDLIAFGLLAVAAGLCVWDVGEFSTGLRAELPASSPTLRTETVHTSGSLLYCSAAAIGAWLLYQLLVPQLTPPAPEIAAIGVVLSLGIAALLSIRVSAP